MGERKAQGLAHHLRGGCGPQKLAPAAGAGAGAAPHVCGVLQRDLLLREAGPDGLHLARVLAFVGQERNAAGDQDRRPRSG